MGVRVWARGLRLQFLTLTLATGFLGASVAYYSHGGVRLFEAILALAGALIAHAAVNVWNDYFDYTSGLDLLTRRTPFSGGSGVLPEGLISPRGMLTAALLLTGATILIGAYFYILYGPWLVAYVVAGITLMILYSPVMTKIMLGEIATFLGFGPIMTLGMYLVSSGTPWSPPAIVAAVFNGLLVAGVLVLNEIPDIDADREVGRKTIPVVFGSTAGAKAHLIFFLIAYLALALGVLKGLLPLTSLISLIAAPSLYRAYSLASSAGDVESLIPALAENIKGTHLASVLLGIGLLMGVLLPLH